MIEFQTTKRSFALPTYLENSISKALESYQIKLDDSEKIAQAVLKMSDFYINNPEAETPWNEKWCQISQISYYLPLNTLRTLAIRKELERFPHFLSSARQIIDFGWGLGAGSQMLNFKGNIAAFEKSREAIRISELFFAEKNKVQFISENELRSLKDFIAVFSYSLTEIKTLPSWAYKGEGLIIVEPATQEDGRKLLTLRDDLLKHDFEILAPCTHQGSCPLLTHSKADWCHDRIFFEMPSWFAKIEAHLPIKNQNLTFSYLIAQKKKQSHLQPDEKSSVWRVIGDSLEERGKTRQMICRNSEREFLSWLHRYGSPQTLQRGQIITPILEIEKKSNELRLPSTTPFFES